MNLRWAVKDNNGVLARFYFKVDAEDFVKRTTRFYGDLQLVEEGSN